MRVLSIRQPWVALIMAGRKDVENRSWSTDYRGKLAIHASQAAPSMDAIYYARSRLKGKALAEFDRLIREGVPRGAIVGVVELASVHEARHTLEAHCCLPWGDAPDGYHWRLARPRALDRPIQVKGKLNLWTFDDARLEALAKGR